MKQLLVCALVLLVSFATNACQQDASQAAEREAAVQATSMQGEASCAGIEGAWELVSARVIYPDSTVEVDASQRQSLKLVTPTHWVFVSKSPETGEVTGAGGGRHTTEGNTHTVEREYHTSPAALEAGPTPYDCRIEGDTWYHEGDWPDYRLEEVWQRVR